MQLKGLVRFFTILLIAYSIYQLSFTWFVRNHEKKMESRARSYVAVNFPTALDKFPGNKDSQAVYQEFLDKIYADRLKRLLDSTKETTVTYGFTGPMSYQKAKEQELNLGLDLQGGMNVTLEVEMSGLLNSLSNNSNDPNFLKAVDNATKRKANSSADFITLFFEEYRKLEQNRPMASLFSAGSNGVITVNSSDSKVEDYIRTEAKGAFDRTFRVLRTRIDQFGVAQPNINPNRDRGIINVELPGIKDKERVRKILQSTANLQFWEVYKLDQLISGLQDADKDYDGYIRGVSTDTATTTPSIDTNVAKKLAALDTNHKITGDTNLLSNQINNAIDTGKGKLPDVPKDQKRSITELIQVIQDNSAILGMVEIKDSARVREVLNAPIMRRHFPADGKFCYGTAEKKGPFKKKVPLYVLRTYGRDKAILEGDAVTDARQDYDQTAGNMPIVSMEMNPVGAAAWATLTEKSFNQKVPIAIALDDIIYSAPIASEKITGGRSQIRGNFTVEEAQDLANLLKIGKLPAPAKIVQEQQVGPTLGSKAIRGGTMAFAISFIVIFLLMLVYYNNSGWVANIALILNLLFTIGVLSGLGATLTAPGIAGLVLTIGMAVDTNVIIYERIKEELSKGKGYIPSINEGYKRSLPPVLDAHVTVLLTAIILFYFGLGPVKGFATTQILGILLSLFCGILVSRWVTEWFTSKKKHLEYFTGVSRKIFKHAKFKFIEYRKVAYVISFVVLGLGIFSYFNGFDEGVEFKGGRSYKIDFGKKVNVEQVRNDLKIAFAGENPVIKTIGDNATLDITTSHLINSTGPETDSIVEMTLLSGLKNHLPPNITYQQFDTKFKQESKTVLPTISDDLKSGAIKATVFALLVIFLYIFMRFRDWRYSLGTIVSLLHDVFVILIVFSFGRSIVPFPLEIDQHFIAAVLTVIGFSMNDTVIVFDRIREDSRLMPNAPRGEVINRAINETLSRTIMTSLTVFLTLLILFIVGGEVTRGFAFAMLIGVITGTYSSIFVAAPILVDLGGKRPLGRKMTFQEKSKLQTESAARGVQKKIEPAK
ncbi:MAG TPA: protein translocase subunit SecDF [Chitinophagaceae bacterium]|nr:protein translocase subunit SecDF [Chitinophagaceae bacterium]